MRFLLAVLAALALGGVPAWGQTSLSCSDWKIEVCEEALPISSNYGDPGCEDGCYRVNYYFYLVRTGSQGNIQTEYAFTFNSLFLTGTLSTTPWNLSVSGPGISDVNLKATDDCAPVYPGLNNQNSESSPVFSYDPISNQFSYEVSAASPLSWSVFGRMPLFTMSVDVFPGEIVEPTGMGYTFVLTDGESNTITCNDNVQACHDLLSLPKQGAQPTTACASATSEPFLRLGAATDDPKPGFPMRKRMPVWVYINSPTNADIEWEELDFLLTVDPGQNTTGINGALVPWIEGGLMPASSVRGFKLQNKYRLYAHHIGQVQVEGGQTSASVTNTLFYIIFDGPQLESECAEAVVGFADRGRMDGGDVSCCKPNRGGSSEATWNTQNCLTQLCSDIELRVVRNTTYQGGDCSGLMAFDLVAVSSASTTIYLRDIRAAIRVKKTGTFDLDASETNSPHCSPNDCITVTDVMNTYLRVEYVTDQQNIPLSPSSPTALLATIVLSTQDNGYIEAMHFLDAAVLKANSSAPCLVLTGSEFSPDTPDDDICAEGGILDISAENASGQPITNWDYYVNYHDGNYPNCRYNGHTNGATTSKCVCSLQSAEQNVVLKKANDYYNGVSTADMIAINRHVLGLVPLTGFKLLASDVNMSTSPTTADIVEIRKLILGLITSFPSANSWRFIDKDLKSAVENATNPFAVIHAGTGAGNDYTDISQPNKFADEEFEEFALPPTSGLDGNTEFVGFKVGDANGNAIPGNFQQGTTADRSLYEPLAWGLHASAGLRGQDIEIPVFGMSRRDLLGWQAAIGFDTNLVRVTGVRWAFPIPSGAAQDRAWHLTHPGELRLLWFGGAETYGTDPGKPLFFVQATLLRPFRDARPLLHLLPESIPSEAYDEGLKHYALQLHLSDMALVSVPVLQEADQVPLYHLSVYPNPSATVFRLQIEATVPCAARLSICDALGRQVYERSLDLAEGLTSLPSTQLPPLAEGSYLVSLFTPTGVETLRTVRR
ncbi:MAG: T9SS type A sorting domain-containing protein [Saprospiraceae bacterium]